LLGTTPKDIEEWNQIRGLIGKIGKLSLKRKISDFTLASCKELPKKRIAEARRLNTKVDVERVRDISKGITTFYAWCVGVLNEL
jgi:hypothetical protein